MAGIDVNMGCPKDYSVKVNKIILNSLQGRKKPRSSCLGQVNLALGQVNLEAWMSSGPVKLASVVLVIISNQKQFQNLRLRDELNNELKA